MQDAHTIIIGVPGSPDYNWFGVYDGHGGTFVSKTSAQFVLSKILETEEWKQDSKSIDSVKEAIRKGFLVMDEALRKVCLILCLC